MTHHPREGAPPDPLKGGLYGCETGKIGWTTKSQAKTACKLQGKRGKSVIAVYKCGFCDQWHTTKQAQRQR